MINLNLSNNSRPACSGHVPGIDRGNLVTKSLGKAFPQRKLRLSDRAKMSIPTDSASHWWMYLERKDAIWRRVILPPRVQIRSELNLLPRARASFKWWKAAYLAGIASCSSSSSSSRSRHRRVVSLVPSAANPSFLRSLLPSGLVYLISLEWHCVRHSFVDPVLSSSTKPLLEEKRA